MTYSDCFTNEQLHHALAKAVAERDEARAAAISRRYTCHECGRKGRHSKQNRGAQPICPPCDFSRLFGSGRPEDWEGFDEAVEGWRESPVATAAIDRLATIASEAFGPLPVQSAEENLTAIESGIYQLRMDNEKLELERDEARMQYRTTELLGMALVKTIDQLKAEKAAIFAQLVSLQAGSRRATLDEIAESVREKYDPEHEGEGMEND